MRRENCVIVERNAEGLFVASVPVLPGCTRRLRPGTSRRRASRRRSRFTSRRRARTPSPWAHPLPA